MNVSTIENPRQQTISSFQTPLPHQFIVPSHHAKFTLGNQEVKHPLPQSNRYESSSLGLLNLSDNLEAILNAEVLYPHLPVTHHSIHQTIPIVNTCSNPAKCAINTLSTILQKTRQRNSRNQSSSYGGVLWRGGIVYPRV